MTNPRVITCNRCENRLREQWGRVIAQRGQRLHAQWLGERRQEVER